MKKLLSTLLIAPLALTACGAEEIERDTYFGKGENYVTVAGVDFDKDTFYQLALEYGSSAVMAWMNSSIAEYEAVNQDLTDDKTSAVQNGLGYYKMFETDGAYDHDKAIDLFTSEILWEEFQTHSIINGSEHNTSFALEVANKGQGIITVADIEAFDADLNNSTDRDDFLTAAKANLLPYYEEVRKEAGERLMTVNWLLSQETVTKISGSTYYKPSSRLEDIYSDNTPTEWSNFTFDSEKIGDVTTALGTFDFDTGTVEAMDTLFNNLPTGDATANYSINGMGTKNSAFNAPTEVTNVAHSSNDEYRKIGWVNTGTEDEPKYIHSTGDDEFTIFYANPIELENYHYASGDEGPDGPADESDLKGLLKPDRVEDATDLQDARRLYSYFKLSQISDVQSFAVNYYYSEWELKAFDETIHDAIGSDLDN